MRDRPRCRKSIQNKGLEQNHQWHDCARLSRNGMDESLNEEQGYEIYNNWSCSSLKAIRGMKDARERIMLPL